jgi:dTDP-glucose pyrophosphorylase
MKIEPLILSDSTLLKDAIRLLDDQGFGVLPVLDKNRKFYGLITDGDIRRALLNDHLDMKYVVNTNPITIDNQATLEQCRQLLREKHRRHLPLIDSDNNYIDMFVLDEVEFINRPNIVVIMAGGLGSRLGALTMETPKPMLKVGNKPILQVIIEMYIARGFQHFYLSVNYKKEQIMDYFGNGSKWGIAINYLVEKKRLGTGGSLSLLEKKLDHPFIVSNADVFTEIDYDSLFSHHKKEEALATMCVKSHSYALPYGVVKTEGSRILAIEEKPVYNFLVNAGVYLFDPKVLNYVPKDTYYDMPTLFETLVKQGMRCSTFSIDGYWVDIGLVEEYERIRERFGY